MYSERLKDIRERNDMTQKNVAEVLGIAEITYTNYENEYFVIPIKHLNTLSNYFDVSFDYIFNFTDKKQYKNSKNEIDKLISGQRLKNFRKELKLSGKEFGNILNTTDGTLYGYERGRYLIATPFLYDICKKYGVSADYLLGKIDEPKYLK